MKPHHNVTVHELAAIDQDLRGIARYDHSVSVPSLGSLFRYEPESPLGQAQNEIAQIYGSAFAFPSTGGTTPLNVLAALSLTKPGDKVLVQRDSHASVLAPLIHADLQPTYLSPSYLPSLGVTAGISAEDLARKLDQEKDIRLVFITYPNYFGIATDIRKCLEIAASKGVPSIVDSAHGAHLTFHPSFPLPAEQAGATIVTQSTHKTLPALGQASIALFKDLQYVDRFYEAVNQLGFVSTSFSSIILLSLFRTISAVGEAGYHELGERLEMSAWAREQINQIDGYRCFGPDDEALGTRSLDPLRLTVNVEGLGITGFEAEERLLHDSGHYAEMATIRNVLFILTLGTSWESITSLIEALKRLAKAKRRTRPRRIESGLPPTSTQVLSPRQAFYSSTRTVRADQAIGQVSGETISAYPPGSAIIVAGELLTHECLQYLKEIYAQGGVLKGASSKSLETIKIIPVK